MSDRAPASDAYSALSPAGGGIAIVSNREPYEHTYGDDGIAVQKPSGGLTQALDGVLGRLGGTWVAWGSGSADFDPGVVSGGNTVRISGEDRAYDLRRIRLTDAQTEQYYYGYSNQVLWPLCHFETDHVEIEPGYWGTYREVNRKFADVVAGIEASNVWFQDYHLALAPAHVRSALGDDKTLVHFWHIPWPSPDFVEICPHHEEILRGLLGNDAIGFHTERYRRRFLESVDELLAGATASAGADTVAYDGRRVDTFVNPVGVDPRRIAAESDATGDECWTDLADRYGIDDELTVALGVDRLDYTKGILERLDALDHLWATRPEFRGGLVYVQKATKTREKIGSYRRYHRRVLDRIEDLNGTYGTPDWTPVVYFDDRVSREELIALYRGSDLGIVSSRRDGMNLVALEYVAASEPASGGLALTEFAGAADVLSPHAPLINPFDTEGFARTLADTLHSPPQDRRDRHAGMMEAIRRHSLDSWVETMLRRTRSVCPESAD